MPAAVVAVAGMAAGYAATAFAVAEGFVVAGSLGAAVVSGVASMVTSSVLGGIIGSNEQPQQPSAVAEAARGVLVNTAGTVDPINACYGRRRIGGTRCLTENSGTNNAYLHVVIAHCEGEIDGFDGLYFDNVAATDPRFSGLYTVEQYTGADAQAASAALIAALPGKWSAAHTLSGVAYTYVCLTYDANAFSGLPVITTDLRGRKVYDPRSGLTAFSTNPALCLRDYLTNTRFGRAINPAAIDDTSFMAAANYCDVAVTTPAGTQPRYTCNGLVDTSKNSIDNVRGLLTCMRGMLVFSGGKHKLVLDQLGTAAFNFNEDNITGAWNIKLGDKRSRYNRVRGTWINPGNAWQADLALADSASYRAIDNGLMLESQIELPFTTNAYEAQMLGQRHLKQSRFGTIASFRATIAGLGCEVGDIVSITHSTPGWTAKPFRVVRIGLLSSDEVEVTAVEYDDSVYAVDPLTAPRVSTATNLPDPFRVAAPGGLTLTSGTAELLKQGDGSIVSRIRVAWPPPADIFVIGAEIQMKLSADSAWQTVARPGKADVSAWLSPVLDGSSYDVRLRFINAAGVSGAWTAAAPHTVIGKQQPPGDVANLTISGNTLSWPAVGDIDLAGYRIKFQYGVNLEWGTANQMHVGLVTASPYVMLIVPPGQVTIMARAVDTTGNESANSAYVITNFGNTPVANVVESVDFKALTWPGTITNAGIVGGNLQATQSDPFFKAGGSDFYGADGALFYSTNYDGLEWISTGWTPSLAAAGSAMTIAFTLTGGAQAVQYRQTGPLPFYGADLSTFYGVDAGPFYSASPAWQVWPGSVVAANEEYQWRVATSSGPDSGLLSAFAVSVDVPDTMLMLNGVAIGSGGTRLAGAIGQFNAIQNVQLTLQGGSTAVSLEIADKSATLGPLINAKNSAGAGVAATIDALLQGY